MAKSEKAVAFEKLLLQIAQSTSSKSSIRVDAESLAAKALKPKVPATCDVIIVNGGKNYYIMCKATELDTGPEPITSKEREDLMFGCRRADAPTSFRFNIIANPKAAQPDATPEGKNIAIIAYRNSRTIWFEHARQRRPYKCDKILSISEEQLMTYL